MKAIGCIVGWIVAMTPALLIAQELHPCETVASPELAQTLLDTRSNPNDFTEYDPDGDGIACEPDELASVGVEPDASRTLAPGVASCDIDALRASEPTAAETLDGRLGGSLESFTSIYGVPDESGLLREYTIPGCGTVFVSDFEGKVVTEIMLFSPRTDDGKDLFEPDEADWTIDEARLIAESFLPPDAVLDPPLGEMTPPETGMMADNIEVRGTSDMLLQHVPRAAWEWVDNSPTYGGFSYWLLRGYGHDVYSVVVQLEIED